MPSYIGKKIQDCFQDGDQMRIIFEDGSKVSVYDCAQSCCEHRYMKCDDNPGDLIGQTLRSIEVKDVDYLDDTGECHEVQFVEIATDKDFITMCNHNEHNGYYGGFTLEIRVTDAE